MLGNAGTLTIHTKEQDYNYDIVFNNNNLILVEILKTTIEMYQNKSIKGYTLKVDFEKE